MKLILSLFIFSIFLFINKSAFAEWSLYGETDAGYHFINLDDTSSDNKYVYYWILTDYKEPQSNDLISVKFFSKKVYKQTDCRRFRTSASEIIIYSEKMSEGEIIIKEKYDESSFSTPNFDSIGFEELEVVCSYTNN